MLRISRAERAALETVGLLHHKKVGVNRQDPNFIVVNRQRSQKKHYYVAEDREILLFLGRFDMVTNLKQITKEEMDILVSESLLFPNRIQHPGQYLAKSAAYVGSDGRCYIEPLSKFLIRLGYSKPTVKA